MASYRGGEEHPFFGKKLSAEHCKNISIAKKGKASPNKGKTFSAEHRANLSKSHTGKTSHKKGKTYEDLYGIERAKELLEKNSNAQKGRKLSESTKVKQSNSLKKFYAENDVSAETRQKLSIANKGRQFTEEHCKKISDSKKGKPSWDRGPSSFPDPDLNLIKLCACGCNARLKITKNHKYNKIPDFCPGHQSRIIQLRKFEDTSIEVKLQNALLNEKINFEKHKRIHGIPDIFIEPNICIFADGDYWHANPVKYSKDECIRNHTTVEIWNKDKKVTDMLTKKGYKVIRFWEQEINSDISLCISKIKKELTNVLHS